jgi:hypothetical protein
MIRRLRESGGSSAANCRGLRQTAPVIVLRREQRDPMFCDDDEVLASMPLVGSSRTKATTLVKAR